MKYLGQPPLRLAQQFGVGCRQTTAGRGFPVGSPGCWEVSLVVHI
jgi:hypothetical protein